MTESSTKTSGNKYRFSRTTIINRRFKVNLNVVLCVRIKAISPRCGDLKKMDFATKEIFKRYASILVGRPISPVFLNILVTSVCDMRCTHCFFTEELDDRPRKKLQMKTEEIERISETLGGNLGVLILAGGEPFTRKDIPEIVRSFYENNKLDSVYLMSNGQIHPRIFPDVTRILDECPKLNVTVALGIDGVKSAHEKIRRKEGSW